MMKQPIYNKYVPGNNPGFCQEDCSVCGYDKYGEMPRFRRIYLDDGQPLVYADRETSHILFLQRGMLLLETRDQEVSQLSAGQCRFSTRGQVARITAKGSVKLVQLDFVRRMEIGGYDCLQQVGQGHNLALLPRMPPVLTINPLIDKILESVFVLTGLESRPCFCHLKMTEISMMMTHLYSTEDLVCFFRSVIRPADDFRAFVLTHYNRIKTVAEFAVLAGMSKSVFQQRFAEVFGDTVSNWLTKQKAAGIRYAVRSGIVSRKNLMYHFGFPNDAVFGRYCKTYMKESPSKIIAAKTPSMAEDQKKRG